ncbi:MAG: NosD domain-containing protein [Candidatus Heimdallarchaeaceae archaeon]
MRFKYQHQIVAVLSALSISIISILGMLYVDADAHSPIVIHSDSDFALLGFAGDGTVNNPYQISNLEIDAGSDIAIDIRNTTKYFIISDCILSSYSYAIYLFNISAGTAKIEDNQLTSYSAAIMLEKADETLVQGNTFQYGNDAIHIKGSFSVTVKTNSISHLGTAICLENAQNCIVEDNTIVGCHTGVKSTLSINTAISNNDIQGGIEGIRATSTINISIQSNSFSSNIYGIRISSSEAEIISNTFVYSGLYIEDSAASDFKKYSVNGNTVNGKTLGFIADSSNLKITEEYGQLYLINCYNATVSNIEISNTVFGLYLINCSESLIHESSFNNNTESGVYIRSSNSVTIEKCSFNDNSKSGIKLELSNYANIVNNTCTNNTEAGIYTISDHNTIENNTCSFNEDGIRVEDGYYTTVYKNYLYNNTHGIYLLDHSAYSNISQNYCLNNIIGITASESINTYIRHNSCYNDGILISDTDALYYYQYYLSDNTLNDKEIGYFLGIQDTIISQNIYGQLILIDATNITIKNLQLMSAFLPLEIRYCSEIKLLNSTIANTYYGVEISDSDLITISNVTCSSSFYTGLYLTDSANITISHSSITENGKGIHVELSNSIQIYNNSICQNILGIWVEAGSTGDIYFNLFELNQEYALKLSILAQKYEIYQNSFVYNNEENIAKGVAFSQAYDEGSNNYWYDPNALVGNFWTDWARSGAYSIDGFASSQDLFPLSKPPVEPNVPIVNEFPTRILSLSFILLIGLVLHLGRKQKN